MSDSQRRIAYVRHSETEGVLRIGVGYLSEVVSHTVSAYAYPEAADLAVGDILDEEAYALLLRAEEEYRARRRALSILALSDNNEKTLKMKLVAKGTSRDIAEDVCRRMVELGYIDEHRQLCRIISAEANGKMYGPKKIHARLMAKGYSSADIRLVMAELTESGEVDFERLAGELIAKNYPDGANYEEKMKLLYKYGYK